MAKDEWKLCAEWLVNCKILASDHRVTWDQAEVFDLAQTLRDGVLICHLLNHLKPGAIDPKDFSQRPQMSQFLCLKNIRMFLQTCRAKFGMKESDLFEGYDLFDMKDFGKVINTLSKLSKTTEAAKSGIGGFPNDQKFTQKNFKPEEEDIYGDLEHRACDLPEDDIYDAVIQPDDEIYDDLCSVVSILEQQGAFIPKNQRDHCLKELVETERNYVDALNMIKLHFIKPLKEVLSKSDNASIFFGIEKLHTIHSGFLSELQKCVNDRGSGSHKFSISDTFVKYKSEFLIYGDFCSNLQKAQNLVDEICVRSPNITKRIEECQMKAKEGKFRLRDLLAVPMQRVLKYHLLLKELIKRTEEIHPEKKMLERALEAMQDLSLYVNEVKRDDEAIQLINEIQTSIVDLVMPENTSLKDYGKVLKDGELIVRSHDDSRSRKRYIFLFDKVMMMCKGRGETYTYKHALILGQHRVDEGAASQQKQKSEKWSFNFLLVEKENTKAYTFCAKTEDMRRKWIDAIAMAMDNTTPPGSKDGGHDFTMNSFQQPTTCSQCEKLLRGAFYQGYKCSKCDRSVHKECIRKTRACQRNAPALPNRDPFPVVPPRPPVTPEISKNGFQFRTPIGKCKANYSYQGIPAPDDQRPVLKFETDAVIDLLNDEDPHWWEGRMNGYTGFFPAQYVTKRTPRREYEEQRPSLFSKVPPPAVPRTPTSPLSSGATSHIDGPTSPNRKSPPRSPGFQNVSQVPVLTDMTPYEWYVGEMDRPVAMQRLEKHTSGTYLVRASKNPQRRGEYALSIKFGSSSKHIKINRQDSMYFIADCKLFRSIPDLVEYYQNSTLEDSFPELKTTLIFGYKDAVRELHSAGSGASNPVILGYCRANYDYAANQPNQLSLKKDDRIAIISRAGEDRGWWKGQLRGRIGYFPMAYVVEENDDDLQA